MGITDIYFCLIGNSLRVEIKTENDAQDAQQAQMHMQMQPMPMQQIQMQPVPMQQQQLDNRAFIQQQQQPQAVMMPVIMQPQYQTFQNNQVQPFNQPMPPGYPQQPPIEN